MGICRATLQKTWTAGDPLLARACMLDTASNCRCWDDRETELVGRKNIAENLLHFIKKNPTRSKNVSKFYYSIFIWSSIYFRRHTAHHQDPKTSLEYCAWQRPPTTRPTTFHIRKTRGCQCSFRLLMMGGVSPETYWASYKYGIIKFWYIVASCWIFFINSTMMHGSTNIKFTSLLASKYFIPWPTFSIHPHYTKL